MFYVYVSLMSARLFHSNDRDGLRQALTGSTDPGSAPARQRAATARGRVFGAQPARSSACAPSLPAATGVIADPQG